MSAKTIWLRLKTYERLDGIRGKRESFDTLVNRLCDMYDQIKEVSDTLGPGHLLQDVKKYQSNVKEAANR